MEFVNDQKVLYKNNFSFDFKLCRKRLSRKKYLKYLGIKID